ncbi:MAG: hypothetical protein GY874_06180 [Desulfobacteraceae bacterium]|nr:hypothetical protein [Desulfobacteraceae bacterium]
MADTYHGRKMLDQTFNNSDAWFQWGTDTEYYYWMTNSDEDKELWSDETNISNISARSSSEASIYSSNGISYYEFQTSKSGVAFYDLLLNIIGKLVADFMLYASNINANSFGLVEAAEFQIKLMQFVTCYTALIKGINGVAKAAKNTVDGIQP